MRLTESQLRQIVAEEWAALVAEAGERRIIRPGQPPAPAVQPVTSPSTPASRPQRPTEISDIQATRTKMVTGSPFEAGSDAFNALYNAGAAEEFIRFRVKSKIKNDEYTIGRLVSHVFNAGTYVSVPGLHEKLGLGRIIDIVNRSLIDDPNSYAPLAVVEFGPGQHVGWGNFTSDGPLRLNNVGIAYLAKVSSNDADELASDFRQRIKRLANRPKPVPTGMKTVKYRPGN